MYAVRLPDIVVNSDK